MKRTFNIFSLAILFLLFVSAIGLSHTPAQAAATWENVGAAGFSPGEAKYLSFAIDNGTPYVAYRDGANSYKASVMKFNGTNWVNVGAAGFSGGIAYDLSLAFHNGTPYLAYSNADSGFFKANVMKFNGANWVSVGSVDFSTDDARNLSLDFDNGIPYVAFTGYTNGSPNMLNVMKFDGLNWVNLGPTGFAGPGAGLPSLVFESGTPYVLFGDGAEAGQASLMKFNGTAWVNVGPARFSPGVASYPSLAFDNGTPYVAFGNGSNFYKANVMKFNGTSWVSVGPADFSPGGAYYTSLAFEGSTPYVAYKDLANGGKARVMKFDGTNWVNVGSAGFSAGESRYTSIVFNSGMAYVAFQDMTSGKASVMKFVSEPSSTVTLLKLSGAQDGWVLETNESSNKGGTINAAAATFLLGDHARNRQYRAILHFNTASLPDNAVITRAVLKIKQQSVTGTNPFTTHLKIAVDIRNGAFSNSGALQATDFQAAASRNAVGLFANNPQAGGWYLSNLKAAAYPYINRVGITQFRLRFQTDDDNDAVADFIRFYSGNAAAAADRPILVIEYYVP
jgi:hypothetical protein